jgi:hypothetical protein
MQTQTEHHKRGNQEELIFDLQEIVFEMNRFRERHFSNLHSSVEEKTKQKNFEQNETN